MKAVLLAMLAGCYAPHPQTGSPCDPEPCALPLVCSPSSHTCEVVAVDAATFFSDGDLDVIDGCTPTAEICGDGIDQDCNGIDPPCAANDAPGGAIDISAGGTFTGDLVYARDDAPQADCGGDGGRDLFYKIVLAAPEVVYLDTFGSSFGTVVRVIPGKDCTDIATTLAVCSHDACGGVHSQIATSLPVGTSCVVVDQHAGDTSGMLMLHVIRGGRDGTPLGPNMQTYTSSSCTGKNNSSPSSACASGDTGTAEDANYYFTVCPSQTLTLDASTCVDSTVTSFDTVMYLRKIGAVASLACNDDTATCAARPARPTKPDGSTFANVATTGIGMYWLTVDGYSGACGTYRLDTNLR